jgi:hypothetical protein
MQYLYISRRDTPSNMKMEARGSFETSIIYQVTLHHIKEDHSRNNKTSFQYFNKQIFKKLIFRYNRPFVLNLRYQKRVDEESCINDQLVSLHCISSYMH